LISLQLSHVDTISECFIFNLLSGVARNSQWGVRVDAEGSTPKASTARHRRRRGGRK